MAAKDRLTKTTDSTITPRAIDFLTRFQEDFSHLINIAGVTQMIPKVSGTTLRVTKAHVTLQNGAVSEGDEIPFSQATLEEVPIGDITLNKYSKGVSMEEISKNGYDVAIVKTDNAFRFELQKVVKNRFYSFLNTGTLTAKDTTFQMALAMAKGRVLDAQSKLNVTGGEIVAFVNYLDFYNYLGAASITVQTAFGMNYVQDFMGYRVIFLCDSNEVAKGTVIATPADNLICYYINPGEVDFGAAGLVYNVMGVTPILGFAVDADYRRATSDAFAVMGLVMAAEYLDLIAVETVEASGSIGTVTLVSAAGTTKGTKLTVTYTLGQGEKFYYHTGSSPAVPTYLADMDSSWVELPALTSGVLDNFEVTGAKIVVAAFNGAGQCIATSSATTITNHA